MSELQWRSVGGLLLLCLFAWVCGGCRRGVRPRVVIAGLLGQLGIAAALLHLPPARAVVSAIGEGVDALARATKAGTSLVFGYLGGGPAPFAEVQPGNGFILFFQALPLVLVVGALSALLYHWRILPLVVRGLAAALGRLFGLSGAILDSKLRDRGVIIAQLVQSCDKGRRQRCPAERGEFLGLIPRQHGQQSRNDRHLDSPL